MDEGTVRALGCYQRPKSGQDWEHESLTLTSLLIKPISPAEGQGYCCKGQAALSQQPGPGVREKFWLPTGKHGEKPAISMLHMVPVWGEEGRIFLKFKISSLFLFYSTSAPRLEEAAQAFQSISPR